VLVSSSRADAGCRHTALARRLSTSLFSFDRRTGRLLHRSGPRSATPWEPYGPPQVGRSPLTPTPCTYLCGRDGCGNSLLFSERQLTTLQLLRPTRYTDGETPAGADPGH